MMCISLGNMLLVDGFGKLLGIQLDRLITAMSDKDIFHCLNYNGQIPDEIYRPWTVLIQELRCLQSIPYKMLCHI